MSMPAPRKLRYDSSKPYRRRVRINKETRRRTTCLRFSSSEVGSSYDSTCLCFSFPIPALGDDGCFSPLPLSSVSFPGTILSMMPWHWPAVISIIFWGRLNHKRDDSEQHRPWWEETGNRHSKIRVGMPVPGEL